MNSGSCVKLSTSGPFQASHGNSQNNTQWQLIPCCPSCKLGAKEHGWRSSIPLSTGKTSHLTHRVVTTHPPCKGFLSWTQGWWPHPTLNPNKRKQGASQGDKKGKGWPIIGPVGLSFVPSGPPFVVSGIHNGIFCRRHPFLVIHVKAWYLKSSFSDMR